MRADGDADAPDSASRRKRTVLERWRESLRGATSLAQIFVHLSVLDASVAWSKSALYARCSDLSGARETASACCSVTAATGGTTCTASNHPSRLVTVFFLFQTLLTIDHAPIIE